MPVRDGAPYLEEAVQSVLAQTFDDYELLVVDDGSTDSTAAILEQLAARDARVRVVRQPALGIVPALNRGIADARGIFVARMDADDVSLPNRFIDQLSFLERNPSVVLVGSSIELFQSASTVVTTIEHPTEPSSVAARLEVANCIAHPTVFFRTDAVRDVGGYRSMFGHAEDYDLWLRLADGWKLANLPEPLLRYRVHPSQLTGRNLAAQAVSALASRAVARRRRVEGAEPLLPQRVDLAFARDLGVRDSEIAQEIVASALAWSATMESLGLPNPGRPLRKAANALEGLEGTGSARALLARREAGLAFRAGRRGGALRAAATVAHRGPRLFVSEFGRRGLGRLLPWL